METAFRLVHAYDVASRKIVCGIGGHMNSTKHASGVTCRACLRLLEGDSPPVDRAEASSERDGTATEAEGTSPASPAEPVHHDAMT